MKLHKITGCCSPKLTPHSVSEIFAGHEHQPLVSTSILHPQTPTMVFSIMVVLSINPQGESQPGLTTLGHRCLLPKRLALVTLSCSLELLSNRFIFNSQPWIEEWKFCDFFFCNRKRIVESLRFRNNVFIPTLCASPYYFNSL